jgi:hypothetical protein
MDAEHGGGFLDGIPESDPAEADNIDVGPATVMDLQNDLPESAGIPF